MRLQARPGAQSYGHDIGVLLIDCFNPFIPGDVGNACTYDYPVLYHVVPDVTIKRLVEEGDLALTHKVIEAARYLEAHGVKAITSDCGYMLHFQDALREAVSIPVMISSLIQLPFISGLLPLSRSIGIICASSKSLTEDMLSIAYPSRNRKLVIAGMEEQPEFCAAILEEKGSIDPSLVEAEMLIVGRELLARDPNIGAILVECSNLPPYAKALQEEVQLPVFDFTTMIDYVRSSCIRRQFAGRF